MTDSIDVAALINGGTSTSFQLEVSVKIDEVTPADVTIVSFCDESLADVDPDVAEYDMDFIGLGASSRFDINAYRQLHNLLNDFDILHTHYNFIGSMSRIAAIGTDTKIVNTEHTDHIRLSHLQNVVNAATYPTIDTMVFNSESTGRSLRRYERPLLYRTDCTVVHNGIDFNRIAAGQERNDLPQLPAGPKVVTAARLVEVKNLETLVRAMKSVLDAVPNAQLIIIGDGPKRQELVELSESLGIDDAVTFLGYLEREQVYGTISKCDLFVVPSLYEGFCNAAVEAMAVGLPVVASDIDVLNEVIDQGGKFADPVDYRKFAEIISNLLANTKKRNTISNTAKDRASSQFPIEKSAHCYYDIYNELLN